ncbi:hypothetical protein D3C79_982000 [compost metagenome]
MAFQEAVAQHEYSHFKNGREEYGESDHGFASAKLGDVQRHKGIVHRIGDGHQDAEEDKAQKERIIKNLPEALERQRGNPDRVV